MQAGGTVSVSNLPAGLALDATVTALGVTSSGILAGVQNLDAATPSRLGQNTSAGSMGVVIASDQSPVNVAIQADTTQSSDAADYTVIVGDPNGDFAGVNLLEQAMTDGSGLVLNVKTLNGPKLDTCS